MNIAFFISSHGFGHAARASAVMAAIHQQRADTEFEIYTQVPPWFFIDALPGCFHYHETATDVGMMQSSPLDVDLPQTLGRLEAFLPFSEQQLDALAKKIIRQKCQAVVCDISPLGIAVANTAGIPSVLIENFTWDWIYEAYVDTLPRFENIVDYLRRQFQSASIHIQTDPICDTRAGAAQLFPISRAGRTPPDQVRAQLNIPKRAPVVLITMGGIATQYQFLTKLKKRADIFFILPQNISSPKREGNLIHLPQQSDCYHPDLVQAANGVVGKVGYSTLAEVCHAGKPFGYVPRDGFRESATLAAFADAFAAGIEIPSAAFESAKWLNDIDQLLETPLISPLPNAAGHAATIILETIQGGVTARSWTGREKTPVRFDPFSVKKARNIRNALSEAFIHALTINDASHVERAASNLSRKTSGFVYQRYLADRRERYQRVFHQIEGQAINIPLAKMLPIWNAGLFFECHEYLEPIRLASDGDERNAINGLINAAGVFVHLERGHMDAANRSATKAIRLIHHHRDHLSFIENIDELLNALSRPKKQAPRLKAKRKAAIEGKTTVKVNKSKLLHRGRVFEMFSENITLPNGVTTDIDILRHPGASAIVPMADNNTLIWIRQYRHAAGGYIWEIPAGTLNPGENPLACAERELIEETGFSADTWQRLGEIVPVPGYSNERIHLYLATGLHPAQQNLDRDEVLKVHHIPFKEALDMMLSGRVTDGKTICALLMAKERIIKP